MLLHFGKNNYPSSATVLGHMTSVGMYTLVFIITVILSDLNYNYKIHYYFFDTNHSKQYIEDIIKFKLLLHIT